MRQTSENLRDQVLDVASSATIESVSASTDLVYVYGYGPTKSPFFKEAQAVKVNSKGCSLILSVPVSRGQKLLLMNSARQDPVEAEIVGTRLTAGQMYEVEVSFSVIAYSGQSFHQRSQGK